MIKGEICLQKKEFFTKVNILVVCTYWIWHFQRKQPEQQKRHTIKSTCTRNFKIRSYATMVNTVCFPLLLKYDDNQFRDWLKTHTVLFWGFVKSKECVTKSKASLKLINTASVIYVAFSHSLINITFNLEYGWGYGVLKTKARFEVG